MARLWLVLPAAVLCALSGCSNEDVVARCGDYEITVDDLRFEVTKLGPSYRFDGSPEARMKLVENLCARYILTEEAAALGFAEEAEQAKLDAERTAVGEAYGKWKIEKAVRVPRISSLKWRKKLDRRLNIKDIVFRARGLAEEAVRAIQDGAAYDDLEKMYAGDEGVAFNDIGWKAWRDIDRGLTKHLFPLEVGQFSSIVSLSDGYHLFYLADAAELGVKDEVLYLRARKFDRWMKEERARRKNERELVRRYDFRPDAAGVDAALEAFAKAFAGERPPEDLLERSVATFKGGRVSVADLFSFYFDSPPESRFYPGDAYSIIKAAWNLALPDIHVMAGYDMRLDNLYEVKWTGRKARQDYLVPQVEDHFRSAIEVTDADIEQYYRDRKEDLVTPTRYRARRILLETQDEVARVIKELEAGADFASLAERYSHDSYTAAKGGDLGSMTYGIVAAYDSVIDGLRQGEVSRPFETSAGIEILKLEELSGGEQLSFEEALPLIEGFIRNQTANEMLADLVKRKKQDLGFAIDEDLLAAVWLPEPGWKQKAAKKVEAEREGG